MVASGARSPRQIEVTPVGGEAVAPGAQATGPVAGHRRRSAEGGPQSRAGEELEQSTLNHQIPPHAARPITAGDTSRWSGPSDDSTRSDRAWSASALVLSACVRILTVANHLGARGGLERTQMTNCRALAATGHRVDLVYVSAGDFAAEWAAFTGTMVQTGGDPPPPPPPAVLGPGRRRGGAGGRRLRPDVVYVYRYWDIPYAVAVGALVGAPVVFHLCLPPPKAVPTWLRRLSAARAPAPCRCLGTPRRVGPGPGSTPTRISVVLTGIDLEHYDTRRAASSPIGHVAGAGRGSETPSSCSTPVGSGARRASTSSCARFARVAAR